MPDHRINIMAAAKSESDSLAEYIEEFEGDTIEALNHWALEVDVLQSTRTDRCVVEITTGVGGPTTRWVAHCKGDDVHSMTFHHSWGELHGQACESHNVYFSNVEALVQELIGMGA